MFDWIGSLFGWRSAVQERRDNPILAAAVARSAEIYEQTPLRRLIGAEASDRLARDLYLQINAVCNDSEPVAASRQRLAVEMLRFALFQVLVLPPEPQNDASGLRQLPGISGELGPQIDKLAVTNISLRSALHESEHFADDADSSSIVEAEYWQSYWALGSFEAACRELGDLSAERDWYRPFMHTACANQENLYRIDLQMPAAFAEPIAARAPTAYSIFTDIVLSGADDPLQEWLEYHEGQAIPAPGEQRREQVTSALLA